MKNQAKIQRFAHTYTQVSKIGHTLIYRALFSQIAANRMTDSFSINGWYTIGTLIEDEYILKLNLYNIISHIG